MKYYILHIGVTEDLHTSRNSYHCSHKLYCETVCSTLACMHVGMCGGGVCGCTNYVIVCKESINMNPDCRSLYLRGVVRMFHKV